MLSKIFKKRELWSIKILKSVDVKNFFNGANIHYVKHIGQIGIRINRKYQSTVADPFLFTHNNRLYLFYEVKTDHSHGEIHAQSMSVDGVWVNHGLVLKEKFHLSYPQVFRIKNKIYMIPECAQSHQVRLYESTNFPFEWKYATTLIDQPLRDTTVLSAHEDDILLLTTTHDYELKLFHGTNIKSKFFDTNLSITNDKHYSRCAGSIIKINDSLIRPAQDCSDYYGKDISFHIIEEFSSTQYKEKPSSLTLDSIRKGNWSSIGSHHVSIAYFNNSYYLAIDGRKNDSILNSITLGIIKLIDSIY